MNKEINTDCTIEFYGEISGEAKKRFMREAANIVTIVSGVVSIITAGILLFLYYQTERTLMIWLMVVGIPVFIIAGRIPPPKDQLKRILTKKIIIDGNMIVAISEAEEMSKFIEDASVLLDYGEYYFVKFPFGNLSERFVCQKDLLVNGTLEEFEALFDGKIERVPNKRGDIH